MAEQVTAIQAPAGRYVYSKHGKTNPKAPAGRHVYGIGLRQDKSRKTLLLAANHAYNCPDVTSQFSNRVW